MKLRNKKTGEIIEDAQYRNYSTADGFGIQTPTEEYFYKSLKEFFEDWEDYAPQEPLIKDEKIRKTIKYIFPKYALIHIEKQGGKRIFEFGGTRLEIDAPNENAIKHGLSYCIAELCGESES